MVNDAFCVFVYVFTASDKYSTVLARPHRMSDAGKRCIMIISQSAVKFHNG